MRFLLGLLALLIGGSVLALVWVETGPGPVGTGGRVPERRESPARTAPPPSALPSPEGTDGEIRLLTARLVTVGGSIDRLLQDVTARSLRGESPDGAMRQVEELSRERAAIVARLGALRPLRPEAAPAPTDVPVPGAEEGTDLPALPPPSDGEEPAIPPGDDAGDWSRDRLVTEQAALTERLAGINLAMSDLLRAEMASGDGEGDLREETGDRASRFEGLAGERLRAISALERIGLRLASFRAPEPRPAPPEDEAELPLPPPESPSPGAPADAQARGRGEAAPPGARRRPPPREAAEAEETRPARGQGATARNSSGSRCMAIVRRAQLGEELRDAERSFLRRGCPE